MIIITMFFLHNKTMKNMLNEKENCLTCCCYPFFNSFQSLDDDDDKTFNIQHCLSDMRKPVIGHSFIVELIFFAFIHFQNHWPV